MNAVLLLVALLASETREEAVEGYLSRGSTSLNPTDPTRFDRGVYVGVEWVDLARGEGDIILFHLGAAQPLGDREQFLVKLDVPFGFARTDAAGSNVGIGDVGIGLGWRPFDAGLPEATFQALSVRFDVTIPSGSGSRSLGAGDWVFAPALTMKWRLRGFFLYATARWIYAEGVNVTGIRGFNIPGVDALSNTASRSDLNAFNLELSFAWEFDPEESPVHWFAITPDWTSNFADDENDVLILKTRLGRAVSDAWSFDLDFWFPLAGERTQSFTMRFAFVWEF